MSAHVPGNLLALHASESGVRENKLDAGAHACAGELARYITCPTTIRSHVISRYGVSPPIDMIKGFQEKWRANRERYRRSAAAMQPLPDDAFDFQVQPRQMAPKIEVVEPEPQTFQDTARQFTRPVLLSEVIAGIASEMNVTVELMMSNSRVHRFVLARRVLMYVLHKRGNSLSSVARKLGRDHSTVIHQIKQFNASATAEMREIAARFIGEHTA